MERIRILIFLSVFLLANGCACFNCPTLRRATIDEDRYGISLSIPLLNIFDDGEEFLLHSELSFEYIKKTSENSNLGVRLSPAFLGATVQFYYKYLLSRNNNLDISINPSLGLSIMLMAADLEIGTSLIANNKNSNNQFYGGIKVNEMFCTGPSGGISKINLINLMSPFLGIINATNTFQNYFEYYYVRKDGNVDKKNLSGLAYKHSYTK